MAESRYGRPNRVDDIRRACEGAVSIPFTEYVGFLQSAGYLQSDASNDGLVVTDAGEKIVNGGNLKELTSRAVTHFKSIRAKRKTSMSQGALGIKGTGAQAAPQRSSSSSHRSLRSAQGTINDAASSELLDARYEKLESLGAGGAGHVFRARQVPLNREVAVKEIREIYGYFAEEQHAEITRRFTDVVRAGAALAHPNILPIHDVNLERQHPYVVTEFCANGSLRKLISDAETIPVQLALKYLLQTLHALRAAHKSRVVHRGLKPENLLLDTYGNIKVSDFGFARLLERDETLIRQVYVGVNGVAYMAPEIYGDPNSAGPQADIYALGIIFYELLTRRLPGRRSALPSQIDPTLPAGIDDIFDNMTRDSRSERYNAVEDIIEDFEKLQGLPDFLDTATQSLVGGNSMDQLKFKDGSTGVSNLDATDVNAPAVEESQPARPYSYHQNKKS